MELVKVCAFALMGVLLALQFKGGKQEYLSLIHIYSLFA